MSMSTSFFGIKLHSNHLQKRVFHKSKTSTVSARQCHPVRQVFTFCSQNVNLLRINPVSTKGSRLKCTGEKEKPPLWKKGFLLLRASVYIVVVSGLCLLVWFGRNKAKDYVEANVLPSVCSVISEYIQRDVQFGKVRRISPLSLTLESCSFGPHTEEFSCGEGPTVEIRLHPLASLRRGKLVVDAVLSHPSILVVQKKDYSWLGVPSTNGGIQRHSSSEDGIDYRTRMKRISREEAAVRMAKERDDAAREAAEMGYFVSRQHCGPFQDEDLQEIESHSSIEAADSSSFFCMNEGKHDNHSRDTGVEYDMNHADLEKSFGVKFPCSGLNFWSRVIQGCWEHKFKRKAKRSDISASGVAMKRRLLETSALAAHTYFRDQSHGKFGGPSTSSGCFHSINHDTHLVNSEVDKISESVASGDGNRSDYNHNGTQSTDLGTWSPSVNENISDHSDYSKIVSDLNLLTRESKCESNEEVSEHALANSCGEKNAKLGLHVTHSPVDVNVTGGQRGLVPEDFVSMKPRPLLATNFQVLFEPLMLKLGLTSFFRNTEKLTSGFLSGLIEMLKSDIGLKVEDIVAEHVDLVHLLQSEGLTNALPITLDSVHFRGAAVMLLAYGDREVREIENVNGHVKFHNHYSRIYVQLSGNCKTWRSDVICEDGGWLSTNVFVDTIKQKWHANLKIDNFFVPLFERILEIPITWSKGRASGEVHLCMSKGETFPNLHGQLDVTGLNFQLLDAPSCFSNISASLRFRGQQIFLHNASGLFGSIPLEGSGDFGIHPEEGEYHLMFQVPGVEVNALMRTFNMRPLLFPLAGSVTALFNCQGPLDAPVFVGTGMVSRTFSSSHVDPPASVASETLAKRKEIGALAAFDCIPFSYVSANFTFNTDNCVADLYGIRASLVDGGEIQGAGTAWICPEGEEDETAVDVNFSGSLALEKIMLRYIPNYHNLLPLNIGVLHGETKLSGSLKRMRFDIKWTAPTAEGSFSDARGDIIISHDFISVNSSSAAFDLYMTVRTSYSVDLSIKREEFHAPRALPFTVDGVEVDLHMCGFEFFSLDTYALDFPRPLLLKATGRIKFQGVLEPDCTLVEQNVDKNRQLVQELENRSADSLVGEVSISGLKLNQLMLAPQLSGLLRVSPQCIKLDASGRPDESLAVEFIRPLHLQPSDQDGLRSGQLLSIFLQKGQLRANVDFQEYHSASLEIQHFPLDELELASLRGTIQRAEIEFNLQKRRGQGILSILRPKFSGVLGEALDMAVRWSGDVITIEKIIFQQSYSHYELQGEYVLPGTRDRNPVDGQGNGFLNRLVSGNLGSVISSMGRWRMKLEVHKAEIAEMLPLARLLSRSTDPAIVSRSKEFFIQSLQSMGIYSTSPRELLELIRRHHAPSHDVVHEDLNLLGLSEPKGCWHGSLDASGGGNGDTLAEFNFHGKDWECGDYKAQRVLAVGAYSNDYGLQLENFFIQNDNATIHADGTLLGPKANLHFAVLNLPVSLVPTIVQIIESTETDVIHSLRQLLASIKGILHMEGDLRGSLTKPECDVQIRLLDGTIGGVDLERAEVVASLTSTSRFLFNAKFEPVIQNGHVLMKGSIPVTFDQNNMLQQDSELDNTKATWRPDRVKEKNKGTANDARDKNISRDRNEKGWSFQLAESLKDLNWKVLDVGEVRVSADIKDGGMMLVTALSPYANWLHGNADVKLEVRGTVDQPLVNGYALFHRVSISSPVFRKPLTNFGGTVNMKSNRLSINSLESRIGRKGKLLLKGNLPLRTSEAALDDKIELKCEVLEVKDKHMSGQVDSQVQITGSILQPIISGNIKLSHGEVYLPRDGGGGGASYNIQTSNKSVLPAVGVSQAFASRYVSSYFGSGPASLTTRTPQPSSPVNESTHVEKEREQVQIKPHREIHLSGLKLMLGPELNVVYPLILKFSVSGELELNGLAHPKYIRPRGILEFKNGEVELVATQVRLKHEHLNTAKFEPEFGLDPMLDLALVGSGWQYGIQCRASNWQDPVEQDALSHIEAARRVESQLAELILEGDGRLAFEKLATATLEKLMPRIEGEGEFGQARWRLVYSPQIPSSVSADPAADPFNLLASNLSFGTDVEVQLGKRLQARILRQMKESEMATQWSLSYQLTNRLHLRLQSAPSACIFFEYYAPF